VGDKSPKAKDRQKKQNIAGKSQQKPAAAGKVIPVPAAPARKGR